ncbi:hypothetical protein E2C01_004711 [Portunus trituberculatus]|uniref:Uncharacterized protein n=1 Tax=Portunus trituberculatus TaxID=210409 RepID=A0A5B7CTQ8_PORTR|nr:hypothetical protein [Portunus trituberculatus]
MVAAAAVVMPASIAAHHLPHSRPSLTVDSLNRRTNTTLDNSMQSRFLWLPIPVRGPDELTGLTHACIFAALVRQGHECQSNS